MEHPHFDTVLSRLKRLKRCRWGWAAICPAHEDKNRSMTVRIGDTGDLLLKCHRGCSFRDIVAALGVNEKDCWKPQERTERHQPPKERSMSKPICHYEYKEADGTVLYRTVRMEPKDFRQAHPKDGKWEWGLNGVSRRVLYRLDELMAEANRKRAVFFVEGEKDADRLASLGLLATTNAMGALKWEDAYTEQLRGRNVLIIPDMDPPDEKRHGMCVGWVHAVRVARALFGVAASVKIIALPALGTLKQLPGPGDAKWDVSDWLDAGGTKEQLIQLAKDLPTLASAPGEDYERLVDVPVEYAAQPEATAQEEVAAIAAVGQAATTAGASIGELVAYLRSLDRSALWAVVRAAQSELEVREVGAA